MTFVSISSSVRRPGPTVASPARLGVCFWDTVDAGSATEIGAIRTLANGSLRVRSNNAFIGSAQWASRCDSESVHDLIANSNRAARDPENPCLSFNIGNHALSTFKDGIAYLSGCAFVRVDRWRIGWRAFRRGLPDWRDTNAYAMCPCGVTIGGDGSSPVGVTTFEKPSSNMLTRPINLSWRRLYPSLANAVVPDAPNAVPPETAH